MVERFLRYSLEHGRKITLMVADERGIRRMNVLVTAITADEIAYVTARSVQPKQLKTACILSAAYARGDDGDTLKNEAIELKKKSGTTEGTKS